MKNTTWSELTTEQAQEIRAYMRQFEYTGEKKEETFSITQLVATVNSLRLLGVSYPALENLLSTELKKALPNYL